MFRTTVIRLLRSSLNRAPKRVRLFAALAAPAFVRGWSKFDSTNPEHWRRAVDTTRGLWKFSKFAPDLVTAMTLIAQDPDAARIAAWKQRHGVR